MNMTLAQIVAIAIAGYAKDVPSLGSRNNNQGAIYNGTNSSFKQNRRIQLRYGFKHRGKM